MTHKINRRTFCQKTLSAACFAPFVTSLDLALVAREAFQYKPLELEGGAKGKLPVPEGHRVAFGLDYFTLDTSEGLALKAPDIPKGFKGQIFLRLQVAIDTREMDEVEVLLAGSGKKIGHFSIWYPTGLQIFDTLLDCDSKSLVKEGIKLRMVNGKIPMFFLATTPQNGSHFLLVNSSKSEPAWHQALCSERSLQPFSWLEGCVLDGLHELFVRKNDRVAFEALQTHLNHYLVDDKNLIYVDLWARPKDNTFNNLETGNNFALIAQYRPAPPFLMFHRKYPPDA